MIIGLMPTLTAPETVASMARRATDYSGSCPALAMRPRAAGATGRSPSAAGSMS